MQIDHFELELKVVSPVENRLDGFFRPRAQMPRARGLGVIALLSFQRPAPRRARKKASDSRQRPPSARISGRIRLRPKALLVVFQGRSYTPPCRAARA